MTEEVLVNTDKLDEEASFHPKYFPRKEVEDYFDLSKEPISAARSDEGNHNCFWIPRHW